MTTNTMHLLYIYYCCSPPPTGKIGVFIERAIDTTLMHTSAGLRLYSKHDTGGVHHKHARSWILIYKTSSHALIVPTANCRSGSHTLKPLN